MTKSISSSLKIRSRHSHLRVFAMTTVCVVSRYHPVECFSESVGNLHGDGGNEESGPRSPSNPPGGEEMIVLDESSKRNDEWDDFNHPRRRRALILRELYRRCNSSCNDSATKIVFETPASTENCIENNDDNKDDKNSLNLYQKVHSQELITYLSTAWKEWDLLGHTGRDPSCVPFSSLIMDDSDDETEPRIPPLIPCNFSFPRDSNICNHHHPQRSSKSVMGQMGYYCTDTCTPIVSELVEELEIDARTVSRAVDIAIHNCSSSSSSSMGNNENASAVVYALCTHPGHHASRESFGGYCYVNNAALAARLLQERLSLSPINNKIPKIAILDVDYHCGNGTASIFYNDPSVLVVSIHCHPDFEYPFHSGFGDEIGGSNAEGCTLHLPLLPGATWHEAYQTALRDTAGTAIADFGPDAFVVSLGLDTHVGDPCATRNTGFKLRGRVVGASNRSGSDHSDYDCMGRVVGEIVVNCSYSGDSGETTRTIPTIVVQEGGYEMNAVPSAAADVLLGMAAAMGSGR